MQFFQGQNLKQDLSAPEEIVHLLIHSHHFPLNLEPQMRHICSFYTLQELA